MEVIRDPQTGKARISRQLGLLDQFVWAVLLARQEVTELHDLHLPGTPDSPAFYPGDPALTAGIKV
jgi:hypothetical protein